MALNPKPPAKTPAKVPAARQAIATARAEAAKAVAVKPARAAKAPAAAAPAAPAAKEKKPSMSSLARDLLLAGKLDTDAIVAAIAKAFPDKKADALLVKWHRKELVARGLLKA